MNPFERLDSGIGVGEFEIFEVKLVNANYQDYPYSKQV